MKIPCDGIIPLFTIFWPKDFFLGVTNNCFLLFTKKIIIEKNMAIKVNVTTAAKRNFQSAEDFGLSVDWFMSAFELLISILRSSV